MGVFSEASFAWLRWLQEVALVAERLCEVRVSGYAFAVEARHGFEIMLGRLRSADAGRRRIIGGAE